jgi:ferritin-like metal-binding protein YciE
MPSLDSLEELLHEELKDIYDAEQQLTKALPKLIKKAQSPELKEAIEEHLGQTEQHVERLEQVFEQLGLPAKKKKCEGMKHLIAEGNDMIGEAEAATRDAVMIASAQKVEHYEIASYGTLRTWASILGKDDVASLLEETLEEEKAADEKLTQIAQAIVNEEAAAQSGDEEDEDQPAARARRQTLAKGRARSVAADKRNRR